MLELLSCILLFFNGGKLIILSGVWLWIVFVEKLTTETGAGQWGCSLAFACAKFGIDLDVFMVKVSYNQKPYRRESNRYLQSRLLGQE